MRVLSVTIAWVRAFSAVSRAIFKCRTISTSPFPDLGDVLASPARTARAAASASIVSLLPYRRRSLRFGRSTSTTRHPCNATDYAM
jgi:hypothetical protein